MSRFSELSTYKNTILSKLITNDGLVRAIYHNESNFLDASLPPITTPSSLIYKNIFPYAYIPEAQDEQKTYITVMFNNFQLDKAFYKVGNIGFYVFTHFSLMPTDYNVLRTDYILNQIDTLFNKTNDLGIGKLQFARMGDIKPSRVHFGSFIEYKDFSFN